MEKQKLRKWEIKRICYKCGKPFIAINPGPYYRPNAKFTCKKCAKPDSKN